MYVAALSQACYYYTCFQRGRDSSKYSASGGKRSKFYRMPRFSAATYADLRIQTNPPILADLHL